MVVHENVDFLHILVYFLTMQITSIIKAFALTSLVASQHSICDVDHSGRKQKCTTQFKSDAESLAKFVEIRSIFKGIKCTWIVAGELRANSSTGTAITHLPVGFVDNIFVNFPQYAPYIANKTCD